MIFTKSPTVARLLNQLRTPLVFNGYALVMGSGAASVLGVVYWIMAARLYPAEVVGVDTAVLSAIFFLANLAQLNLVHALNRFVPLAGPGTLKLIVGAYIVSTLLALGASIIFLLGLDFWTPSLISLTSRPGSAIWFVVATISWCIFTLQDGVLIGLRQAKWVPLSTIAYALIKLGLIAAFATMFPTNGVLMSWTIPVIFLILPMNAFIFFRLVPNHIRATQHISQTFTFKGIARFVAGNYVSSFVWMATITLLPIIILEKLGATPSAHFYLAWNVAYALYFISINMGMSLVTEGSRDPENLDYYSFQTLKQTLRLIVPAVVVIVIGAPYILHLFGAAYAANDVMLLRSLSLSAVPYVFVLVYISMARVRREVLKILFTYTGLCVAVLLFTNIFVGVYGLEGVGFAWVIGQSFVVAVLLATDLRKAWSPYVRLPGYLKAAFKVPFMMITAPFRNWSYRASARKVLPLVARQLSPDDPTTLEQQWQVERIIPNTGEVRVMTVASRSYPEKVILKIPAASDALERLKRSSAALACMHVNLRSFECRGLLPQILVEQLSKPNPFLVESMVPGRQAETFLRDAVKRDAVLEVAIKKITELHKGTREVTTIDEAILELWIDQHVKRICMFTGEETSSGRGIQQLAEELRDVLSGQVMTTSWIHGDYSPQNILLAEDGSRVTGIVDWERACSRQLPVLDIMHLLLSTRMLVEGKELGDVVYSFLTNQPVSAREHRFIYTDGLMAENPALELRTLILLTWFRHAASSNARQYGNLLWFNKNIKHVINGAKGENTSL